MNNTDKLSIQANAAADQALEALADLCEVLTEHEIKAAFQMLNGHPKASRVFRSAIVIGFTNCGNRITERM